jgi:hypothetical protein
VEKIITLKMRNIGLEHLHADEAVHYENEGSMFVELSLAEKAVNIQQSILESSVMMMKHMIEKYGLQEDEVLKFIDFLEGKISENE